MAWIQHLLGILVNTCTAVISVFLLYQLILILFSLPRMPQLPGTGQVRRFAIVICARNEETVIGHLIESLNQMAYPRAAYQIFVIADNCTDRTATVAYALGARVFERQDTRHVGKGYALNWFFSRFQAYRAQFDAVAFFDADNLVDPQFLAEMNKQLAAGSVAAMGYRDSKNPFDSWVSACASIGFWATSRLLNQSRARVGLSALLGGTGFVLSTTLLANGWHTRTISEDLEFSLQMLARNQRIDYTPSARFFDEQPVSLLVTMRQRHRWAVGNVQNLVRCLPMLVRALPTRACLLILDSLIYLLFIPVCALQLVAVTTQSVLALAAAQPAQWGSFVLSGLVPLIIGYASMVVQTLLILLLEKKLSAKILVGALAFPLFLMLNGPLFILALTTPKLKWHPIAHNRSISLGQMDHS